MYIFDTTPLEQISYAVAFAFSVLIFGRICYNRGRDIWGGKYDSLKEDYDRAMSQYHLAHANLTKTIQRSENYKRLRDEQREKWRIANNRLQTIWAISIHKPVHRLVTAINFETKEHQKFIPDPVPNGKTGACVTRIQGDGSIGNEIVPIP